MTKFFEPINASATHIYHSALELSPLSSIVRKLHYNRRPTPSPRVVVGTQDSWDPSVTIPERRSYSTIWSPCGQFVAVQTEELVKIWDTLASGLHSTLQPTGPTSSAFGGRLIYSPDGRSIAYASGATITIWDIQTGGVVKGIQRGEVKYPSVVWSLDGRVIGTTQGGDDGVQRACIYDVVSGTALSSVEFQRCYTSRIWAHGKSLRVAIIGREDEACAIHVFEAWPVHTKIGSFCIESLGPDHRIRSFSPTTYRASVAFSDGRFLVLDIRSSECLLAVEWSPPSDCFSPDGSFFAASSKYHINIWKYTASHYTPWRKFPTQELFTNYLQFSPTSSSILGCCSEFHRIWRLDTPYTSLSTHDPQLVAFSCLGAYVAAAKYESSTIIVTNLLSPTPFQVIDTGLEIRHLVLTGNVLLVVGTTSTMAWLLTEEGTVDGIPGDGMAGPGDSIWTVSKGWTPHLSFLAEGQIGIIRDRPGSDPTHFYHTLTGEMIDSSSSPSQGADSRSKSASAMGWFHLPQHNLENSDHAKDNWLVSKSTLQRGWVKDPAGKHRLWVPIEWRAFEIANWYYDITTLQIIFFAGDYITIIIKF